MTLIVYDLHSFGAGSCNDMGRYVLFDKPAKSSVKNSVETVTVQFWYAKHLKNKNLILYTYSSFSLLQMDSKNNQYQF